MTGCTPAIARRRENRRDALRLLALGEVAAEHEACAGGVAEVVRHRARQTTVLVRVATEDFTTAVVEVAAAPSAVPAAGSRVTVAADARVIPVFATP
jgi:hypothetical protein